MGAMPGWFERREQLRLVAEARQPLGPRFSRSGPGIEGRNAGGREVGHVARDDRHAVHECGRRDEPVAQGARIRHVES